MRYLPHTADDIARMLRVIGKPSVDALFAHIPEAVRAQRRLDLGPALDEPALLAHLGEIAGRSRAAYGGESLAFLGGERNAVGPAAIPMNAWTHLAVTYDGTTVRLYVNGAASGTAAFTGSIPASTGVLRIGGNSIWGEWYKGSLDELRLYNRALSPAEIQADMNRPV